MQKHLLPPERTWKIDPLLSEKAEYHRGVLRSIANFAKDFPNWHFRVEAPYNRFFKPGERQPEILI